MANTQAQIDASNSVFWNELCGSYMARELGPYWTHRESLAKFDRAFFENYPYLLPLLQPERMRKKQVLEIGLGYGTVGQRLAEVGARVHRPGHRRRPGGAGPHPIAVGRLPGRFSGERPRNAVSGCHLRFRCVHRLFPPYRQCQTLLDETYRVLRPGGIAVLMVYNEFSFRQWPSWPWKTSRSCLFGLTGKRAKLRSRQRTQYDADRAGQAAPETVLLSVRELRRMLSQFESVSFSKQNADPLDPQSSACQAGNPLENSVHPAWFGLDIYLEARKAS